MSRSLSRRRLALLLAAGCAACGTLEGLDRFSAGGPERGDASPTNPPPGGGDADTASDAADGGLPAADDAGDAQGSHASSDAADAAEPGETSTAGDDGGCTCVAAAPNGWQGYAQLAWAAAGAAACAAPYGVAQSHPIAGVDASTECSACTCALPSSGPITCQVELGSVGLLCAGETMTPALQNVCVLTNGTNGDSYGPTMVSAPGGSCAPAGGVATKPAAQTTSATICAAIDAAVSPGCESSGQVCVAPPASRAATVSTKLCIYQAGVQTCPSAYPATYVVSTGLSDSRGCSACSCAAPACPGDGYVQGFTSPNCTGSPAATFDADAGCVLTDNANGSLSFIYHPSHSAWNGSCAPSGGAPTGGVTLDTTSATTFCCMQ